MKSTQLSRIVNARLQHALSRFLPSRCNLCSLPYRIPGGHSPLCPSCFAAAFPEQVRCIQCGLRLGPRLQAFGWSRCRHCRQNPLATRTWVGGDYTAPFDTIAKRLKFSGEMQMAAAMGSALADRLTSTALTAGGDALLPDCLIAVPVSPGRLRERGYNQALLIANQVGRLRSLRVIPDGLSKIRNSGRQAELSARARQINLENAFCVNRPVDGLHIGLVDDVMTTGATLAACEQALLEAGAGQISRLVAFRTPEKPETNPDTREIP